MTTTDDARISEELGLDFATWLLWRSVKGGGKLELSGSLAFELFVLGPMTLVADYGEATAVTLQGDSPALSPEAARALSEGKHLAKFQAKVINQNHSYDFAFNALTFTCASLKLPPMKKGMPPNEGIMERLDHYERFEKFWDEVFEHFLGIHLNEKTWKAETAKIKKWIETLVSNGAHGAGGAAGA